MLPTEWKHALVTPVFKKSDRSLLSNYRLVSLTCVYGKILEHIIYFEVMKHLNLYNILSDVQHDFCQHHSCESQLLLTVHDLVTSLDNSKQIDTMALDFTKAFDEVSHRRLCIKLDYYGIRGPTLDWIRNFLSGRTLQVILDGCVSDLLPVLSGVPQGTVLWPSLFLCFINDVPECVSSKIRLYADDVLLYREIETREDCIKLQMEFDALQT